MMPEGVKEDLDELEKVGLVEKNGEHREGHPLWVVTDYYRFLAEHHPELLETLLGEGPPTS